MIAIVDSGVANLASVMAALQRLKADAVVTSDPKVVAAADRVILPGVGAAGPAMARLDAAGLSTGLRTLTQPLLGICLGMQLLFTRSDESGGVAGLGLLEGAVRRMTGGPGIAVPHIGWNAVKVEKAHPLLGGIRDGDYLYFVHGYAVGTGVHTLASCEHGARFSAVVARDNVLGCQFHPERSGAVGAKILTNFLAM